MKPSWIVLLLATLVVTAGPALARGKQRQLPRCVDRPYHFSFPDFVLGLNPQPRPNGCAPPVFSDGYFIGQDPDPLIRQGLRTDPQTGYENPHKY